MKFLSLAIAIVLCIQVTVEAQIAKSFILQSEGITTTLPPSNSVSDITVSRDTLWFGTDKGLSETANGGASFVKFMNVAPFSANGTSAIALNDGIVWVAAATTFQQDNQTMPAGAGLFSSTDRGLTWKYFPQPVDSGLVDSIQYGNNWIKTLDVTTSVNNITYDLAVTSRTVWSANFAGMLRASSDSGKSWRRVILPPDFGADTIAPGDSLNFDLSPSSGKAGLRQNLNHRVFSVFASNDSTIWVGTAGGINKSTDGGTRWPSWVKFSHQNQTQPISGNFVVAINEQHIGARRIVWAATVNAEASDEQRGVSFSDNGGATWKTSLLGEFAHNIAFLDSIVYVATDDGLFRSSDEGSSWSLNGSVVDAVNMNRFAARAVYAVGTVGDTVWISGPDGIAYTIDSPSSPFGANWKVMRTYETVGISPKTYSYPLPFSPNQEVVRIHYSLQGQRAPVTIRIFDFAMKPVRTLIRGADRLATIEHDELWDGTDDGSRRVSNGTYFYRIEIGNLQPVWGKILVLQ